MKFAENNISMVKTLIKLDELTSSAIVNHAN
jgi:hypothetical protein